MEIPKRSSAIWPGETSSTDSIPGYGETTMVGEFYLGMFHANNDYVAGNSKALLPEALKLATTTDPL